MSVAYEHKLTADDLGILFELQAIWQEEITAQAVINSYENPKPGIPNLTPEFEYKRQIAIRDTKRRILSERLTALPKERLHIATALEESKPYIKPKVE